MQLLFLLSCTAFGAFWGNAREAMNQDDEEDEDFGVRGGGQNLNYNTARAGKAGQEVPRVMAASREAVTVEPSGETHMAARSADSKPREVHDARDPEVGMPRKEGELSFSELESEATMAVTQVKGDRRRLPAGWKLPTELAETSETSFAQEFEQPTLKGDRRRMPANWKLPTELAETSETSFAQEFEEPTLKGDRRRMPSNWQLPSVAEPSLLELTAKKVAKGDRRRLPAGWKLPEELPASFVQEDDFIKPKGDRRRMPADWTPPLRTGLQKAALLEQQVAKPKGDRRRMPADWVAPAADKVAALLEKLDTEGH